jgi:hypothetical protein
MITGNTGSFAVTPLEYAKVHGDAELVALLEQTTD